MDLVLQNRIERRSTPEPNSGCWLWDGSLGGPGYGITCVDGKVMSTHRASYIAFVGEIPVGEVVRHRCGTKSCVNPDHLSTGTHSDNITDSVRKNPEKYRNFSKVDLKTRIENGSVPEPNSGCWLWDGAFTQNGYGELVVNGKKTLAHRAAYSAFKGDLPKGALILRKCSTRLCVNPDHLEIGTHQEKRRARTEYTVPKFGKSTGDLASRIESLSTPEPNTGCHLWAGTVVKSTGYGEIKIDGKKVSAHCASWIAHRGEIPSGSVVMHKCDVRSCVNPDHLSVGSRKDNSSDMSKKGRGSFNTSSGEKRREMSKRAMQTLGSDGLKARGAKRSDTCRRAREARTPRLIRINLLPRVA